jgi:hypothetical protein
MQSGWQANTLGTMARQGMKTDKDSTFKVFPRFHRSPCRRQDRGPEVAATISPLGEDLAHHHTCAIRIQRSGKFAKAGREPEMSELCKMP